MSVETGLRRLPNGKAISALGFGCSSIWAKPFFDEVEAAAILDAALGNGINHLDCGPSYGVGNGERRLGSFLKGRNRLDLVISTKVGTNVIDGSVIRSFTPALLARSFEQSMVRLGLEHIDILYLHGPSVRDLNEDVFALFDKLKRSGQITYAGVNSFDSEVLDRTVETPMDVVMLQYNVGDFRLAPQIARLHAAGKTVMSGTALGRALYRPSTFLPRDRAHAWYLLRILRSDPGALLRGRRLAYGLTATGKSATEAAIQFVVGHPNILSNLFGTSSVAHMISNARAGLGRLTNAQWESLAAAGPGMALGGGERQPHSVRSSVANALKD